MQACQIPACLYAGYQKDIKSLLYEGRWGGLAGGFCLGCLKQRFCLDMRLKGCIFFLFYDVFRRIPTQKQLFLSGLRHSVALGMEDFCAYATLLDFGDNLRCMKQVARLAGAPRNIPICRPASCAMQPREQSSLGNGLC